MARRLPEIEPFADVVELYDSPEQFDEALERALVRRPDEETLAARRRQVARENTWELRYRTLRERLEAIAPARVSALRRPEGAGARSRRSAPARSP